VLQKILEKKKKKTPEPWTLSQKKKSRKSRKIYALKGRGKVGGPGVRLWARKKKGASRSGTFYESRCDSGTSFI